MSYILAALGNPDDPYKFTRHNAGRIVLDHVVNACGGAWTYDKLSNSYAAKISLSLPDVKKHVSVVCVKPETFMNNSGVAVKKFIKSKADADKLVVLHDELDIGLGALKISYDRGAGGHRGVESIISHIKTTAFTRVRIGISPMGAKGVKKPIGNEKVEKHILKDFKDDELSELKRVSKTVHTLLATLVIKGRVDAMNEFN